MEAVVVLSILLGMCVLCWLERGKGCFYLFVYRGMTRVEQTRVRKRENKERTNGRESMKNGERRKRRKRVWDEPLNKQGEERIMDRGKQDPM